MVLVVVMRFPTKAGSYLQIRRDSKRCRCLSTAMWKNSVVVIIVIVVAVVVAQERADRCRQVQAGAGRCRQVQTGVQAGAGRCRQVQASVAKQ